MSIQDVEPIYNYSGHGTQGGRYIKTKGMDLADVAKLIRKELKGMFPACGFSITIERYSGGQSMTVALMSAPFEAILKQGYIDPQTREFQESVGDGSGSKKHAQLNKHTFYETYEPTNTLMRPAGWNNGAVLSHEAWYVMGVACGIVSSYNFDDSDSQVDYFHKRFYFHPAIGKWNKPFRQTA